MGSEDAFSERKHIASAQASDVERRTRPAFGAIVGLRCGGEAPSSVLVESWLEIELYLAVAINSRVGGFNVLYSPCGGIHIEDGPPPLSYPVGLARNFRAHVFRELLVPVESDVWLRERVISMARRLLEIAQSHECTTVEVSPLVLSSSGGLVAADAKIVLDEAAAFRKAATHAAIAAARDKADRPATLFNPRSGLYLGRPSAFALAIYPLLTASHAALSPTTNEERGSAGCLD